MNPTLSLYLHLLRALAALAVYLFHARYLAGAGIPVLSDYGSPAVMIFFVLSGVLIAYAAERQSDGTSFVLARLGRLWSVALPALALTFIADTVGQAIALASYAPMQPYDAFKWVASIGANALFLNQVWDLSIYAGTNGPFWSLSYEFWYYMVFAAGVYLRGWRRIAAACLCCLVAGPKILVALPIWLMGVALWKAIRRGVGLSEAGGVALWLVSIVLALSMALFDTYEYLITVFPETAARAAQQWRVNFWPSSYLIGAVVSLNILAFAATRERFAAWLAPCGAPLKACADLSFGLYLFHYPLMYLVRACLHGLELREGAWYVLAIHTVPLALSLLLAYWCEARKHFTYRALHRLHALAAQALALTRRKVSNINTDHSSAL